MSVSGSEELPDDSFLIGLGRLNSSWLELKILIFILIFTGLSLGVEVVIILGLRHRPSSIVSNLAANWSMLLVFHEVDGGGGMWVDSFSFPNFQGFAA